MMRAAAHDGQVQRGKPVLVLDAEVQSKSCQVRYDTRHIRQNTRIRITSGKIMQHAITIAVKEQRIETVELPPKRSAVHTSPAPCSKEKGSCTVTGRILLRILQYGSTRTIRAQDNYQQRIRDAHASRYTSVTQSVAAVVTGEQER